MTTLVIVATYDTNFNADLLNSSSSMYQQTTQSVRSQVRQVHMDFSENTLIILQNFEKHYQYLLTNMTDQLVSDDFCCSMDCCSFNEQNSIVN